MNIITNMLSTRINMTRIKNGEVPEVVPPMQPFETQSAEQGNENLQVFTKSQATSGVDLNNPEDHQRELETK